MYNAVNIDIFFYHFVNANIISANQFSVIPGTKYMIRMFRPGKRLVFKDLYSIKQSVGYFFS